MEEKDSNKKEMNKEEEKYERKEIDSWRNKI